MSKRIKHEGDELKKYFRSFSIDDSPKMRIHMANECGVEKYTMDNWMYGRAKIPFLAKAKIEEIAGCKIFTCDNE